MKNKKHALLFVSLVCFVVVSGCAQGDSLSYNKLLSDSSMSDGVKVAVSLHGQSWCAEIARSDAAKQQGLSGRTSLASRGGMIFVFPESGFPLFWMKEMQFDLDLVWLHNDKVVDVSHNIPHPKGTFDEASLPRYTPKTQANMVLEVKGNEAADIVPGDFVTFKTTCAKIPSL